MLSKPVAGLIAGAVLCLAAAAHAEMQPQRGYWRTTIRASDQGDRVATLFDCLEDAPVAFLSPASIGREHPYCEFSERQVQDGRISMAARCVEADGSSVRVAAKGAYSGSSVHLTLSRWDGEDAKPDFTAEVRSRRVGAACRRP